MDRHGDPSRFNPAALAWGPSTAEEGDHGHEHASTTSCRQRVCY